MKTKEENQAVKKVSKYAAKKSARIEEAKNKAKSLEELEPQVEDEVDDMEETPTKTYVGKNNRELKFFVQDHVKELAYIPKYNAAIRRFASFNILNYLTQIGKISPDASGKYVNFLWNKVRVSANGLTSEYSYNEIFIINSIVSSFTQFAKSAQDTIVEFCKKEGISKQDLDDTMSNKED